MAAPGHVAEDSTAEFSTQDGSRCLTEPKFVQNSAFVLCMRNTIFANFAKKHNVFCLKNFQIRG